MFEDPVRRNLQNLINQAQVDMATVSRAAGKNHSYIHQFFKKGTPKILPEDAVQGLANFFKVPPDTFRMNTSVEPVIIARTTDIGKDIMAEIGQFLKVYNYLSPGARKHVDQILRDQFAREDKKAD